MTTKTITISGWIVFDHHRASLPSCYPEGPYVFRMYEPAGETDCVGVQPHSITVNIPADFDPRPGQIKALEAKRKELQAQFSAAVTEINRQISQLQAIEHTEAA